MQLVCNPCGWWIIVVLLMLAWVIKYIDISSTRHTKYLNRNNIKNILISSEEKNIYKQFNLYGKLTKAKFNFDSN